MKQNFWNYYILLDYDHLLIGVVIGWLAPSTTVVGGWKEQVEDEELLF